MEMLVLLDHYKAASEKKKENTEKVKGAFISLKDNLGGLKKLNGKIALNGWMSLIENFMEHLGTNLKSFKTFVLFWNKAKTWGLIWNIPLLSNKNNFF